MSDAMKARPEYGWADKLNHTGVANLMRQKLRIWKQIPLAIQIMNLPEAMEAVQRTNLRIFQAWFVQLIINICFFLLLFFLNDIY